MQERVVTLIVKNLPDLLHRKLKAQAKRERRSVAQEVTGLMAEALETPERISILGLRGLGKEYWRNVDAVTHVRQKRDSWDRLERTRPEHGNTRNVTEGPRRFKRLQRDHPLDA